MEIAGKILVAEDEYTLRDMISVIPGFNFVTAIDGQDAWEKIGILGIDNVALVITDIDMPRLNGPGLIAKVRELDPWKKFIVMSGNAEWEQKVQDTLSLAQGRATFLYKPFTFPEFFLTIERVLN